MEKNHDTFPNVRPFTGYSNKSNAMIRKSILLIGLFLWGWISGCTQKVMQVGFLMDTEEVERWKKDRRLFTEEIELLGGVVHVEIAQSSAAKQREQALRLMDSGINVLVVIPVDQDSASDWVVEANRRNIPVISYDRLIRNCPLTYYVATNNIEIGQLQASVIQQIAPKGAYLLITGPESDHNAALLRQGWLSVLQQAIDKGEIQLVTDLFTSAWVAYDAYATVKQTLEKGIKPTAIIAGNDVLASGALMALKEFDMDGKVLLAGQDAEMQALRQIVSGNQTLTIAKPIDKLARSAAQLAMQVAGHKNMQSTPDYTDNGQMQVPTLTLPARVVNIHNIRLSVVSEDNVDDQEIFQ